MGRNWSGANIQFTAITSMQHNTACTSIRHSPVLHSVIGICTGYEGQYSLKTASIRQGAGGRGHWFLLATINRLHSVWDSVVNAYLLAPLANTRSLQIGKEGGGAFPLGMDTIH